MRNRRCLILIGLALVCTISPKVQAGIVEDLQNREWRLQSFGPIGKEVPVIPNTELTIEFVINSERFPGNDISVEGFSGCNIYFGFYDAKGDGSLSFQEFSGTLASCRPQTEKQENAYLTALGKVSAFEIEAGHLRLFYDDGESALNFVDPSIISTAVSPKQKLATSWGTIKRGSKN